MPSANRGYFDDNPDAAALFDELFYGTTRSDTGVSLGDVARHAQERLVLSYQVLCVFVLLRELGRLNPPVTVRPTGAFWQDKPATGDFPAAHALPCDLFVEQAAMLTKRPYELLLDPFSRTTIQRLFGRTHRVHRLTNVADSNCEAGAKKDGKVLQKGMKRYLAEACEKVANESCSAISVFDGVLTPGYREVAAYWLNRRSGELTEEERKDAGIKPLLDQFGRAFKQAPSDLRLKSTAPGAASATRVMLMQILRIYAEAPRPPDELLIQASRLVEGMRPYESAQGWNPRLVI